MELLVVRFRAKARMMSTEHFQPFAHRRRSAYDSGNHPSFPEDFLFMMEMFQKIRERAL